MTIAKVAWKKFTVNPKTDKLLGFSAAERIVCPFTGRTIADKGQTITKKLQMEMNYLDAVQVKTVVYM